MYVYFEKCVIKATAKINTETRRIQAINMSVIHGINCENVVTYMADSIKVNTKDLPDIEHVF